MNYYEYYIEYNNIMNYYYYERKKEINACIRLEKYKYKIIIMLPHYILYFYIFLFIVE